MAITTVSSSTQSVWRQLQLQQSQRNVDLAEQKARALQAQASNAQAAADQAQQNADSLKIEADQAQSSASQASLWLQIGKSIGQIGTQVNNAITHALQNVTSASVPVQTQTQPQVQTQAPPAVVNSQGQTIGTTVNTTA
jgi:hypothetical protein